MKHRLSFMRDGKPLPPSPQWATKRMLALNELVMDVNYGDFEKAETVEELLAAARLRNEFKRYFIESTESYKIDDGLVIEYRLEHPGNEELRQIGFDPPWLYVRFVLCTPDHIRFERKKEGWWSRVRSFDWPITVEELEEVWPKL